MASSRWTGTSETISTYGTGKDYVQGEFADWESATEGDLGNGTEVLEIYANAGGTLWVEASCDMAGATSTDIPRILRPASGEGHSGIFQTTVAGFSTTDQFISIRIAEDSSQVQDLCGANTHGSYNGGIFAFDGTAKDAAFVGCLAGGRGDDGTSEHGFFSYNRSGTDYAFTINCACNYADHRGYLVASGYMYSSNCTSNGAGSAAFEVSSGAVFTGKNCLASKSGGSNYTGAGTANLTTCGSDDATGSAALQNLDFRFMDEEDGDLHHASNTDALGVGTDLSADTYPFDDDIDGDVRS